MKPEAETKREKSVVGLLGFEYLPSQNHESEQVHQEDVQSNKDDKFDKLIKHIVYLSQQQHLKHEFFGFLGLSRVPLKQTPASNCWEA